MKSLTPYLRCRDENNAPVHMDRDVVVYWMIAHRRTRYNFGLQRAAEWAAHLNKPLVVFEALRTGHEWASERVARFVIDGMVDNAAACAAKRVTYIPYVEPKPGEGRGLLRAITARACVVVTDYSPCFFLPAMVAKAADSLDVRLESVDSNGIYPLHHSERVFTTAASFRRHLHKTLRPCLDAFPIAEPLTLAPSLSVDPRFAEAIAAWPQATALLARGKGATLDGYQIQPGVTALDQRGGAQEASERLARLIDDRLGRYPDDRNHPDRKGTSGLSAYLHFGHISAHEIVSAIFASESWTQAQLAEKPTGSRAGWWGMSEPAEAFIDQIITWRELGYVFCHQVPDFDRFETLPAWAQKTLNDHAEDHRPVLYDLEQLREAKTHDRLWNAAQRQLIREGWIHNYLRMLWAKKILEWSESPRIALDVLVELNNRYAIDGRNPNSYSGIFWCLGRFDRAWGPERQIFGKIRYMSSDNTVKKVKASGYLARYAP